MEVVRNQSHQVEFVSRVSARAVTAGVFAAFAVMIMLEALAGGFGLWRFNLSDAVSIKAGFWFWSVFAWAASIAVGGCVAAIVSRSRNLRDGLIHGLTVWGAGCVLGCVAVAYFSGRFMGVMSSSPVAMGWAIFFGDALALVAGLYGAYLGTNNEVDTIAREEVESTEFRKIA